MTTTLLVTPRPRKTIGLTALIDVVFILLMFFMLTSSFSQWRSVSINSGALVSATAATQPALIVIQNDGLFTLNTLHGDALTAEQLRRDVPIDQPALLVPQASTPVQTIVAALALLKSSGFEQLSLGRSLRSEDTTH